MAQSETASDVRYGTGPASTPSPAALPQYLPRRVLDAITNNIVLILGIAIIMIIIFTFVLSLYDRTMPDAILVMGGVALGYLGNAIQGDKAAAA